MFLSGQGYPPGYTSCNSPHPFPYPVLPDASPDAVSIVGPIWAKFARQPTPERGGACGSVLLVRIWLTEAAIAFGLFFALTFLFVSWFVSRQYARYGRFAGWPALVSAAVVLYGSALIAFTMFPLPNFAGGYCERRAGRSAWQLVPFGSLDDVSAYAASNGVIATLFSGVFLQVLMNVIFFVPLGFFLAYRSRRSLPFAFAVSLGVSLLIELTQGTGLWGLVDCPYRLADVDDVITNTSGGVLGWFIGLALRRVLPDPTPHREPDPGPPGPVRQAVGVLLDVQIYLVVQIGVFALANPALQGIIDLNSRYVFEVLVTLVTLTLFVFIPMLRGDRASPGLASVHLAVVRKGDHALPAALWSVIVRWMVRWLPVTFFGLAALLVILPIEAIVSWRAGQHRSIASMLSRTLLVTRESVGREHRSEDGFVSGSAAGANRSDAAAGDL